ncbi:MAG: glycogen/starch synthase [Candidatus Omnitrophica bacterium]|nr:glycogen/starch synthase [Candidatus Omnitrophota bacterium]
MRNKIIAVLLSAVFLALSPAWAHGGFDHGSNSFISPRVTIEKTALQKLLSNTGHIKFSDERMQELILQEEITANQPLAIARKLWNELPSKTAQIVLREIPDDKKWNVLKKLPASYIAVMLDTLKYSEAGRILQQMKPLKAGLVLKAMTFRENVFSELSPAFQALLLKTPGPRQIVHATIEEAEFFRCGGLADILKNLPRETAEQGDIPSVFMPLWAGINKEDLNYIGFFTVPMDSQEGYREERIDLFYAEIGDLIKYRIYFVENHSYFDVDKEGVFSGRMLERFIVFDKAVVEALRYLDMRPDIIHCHEWQTGLIPVYLKVFYQERGVEQFRDTVSVYTSHNPGYDIKGQEGSFYMTGLDKKRFFRFDGMETYNEWSFSKAGLMFSDISNTVGRRIAEDARTQDFIGSSRNNLKGTYQYLMEQGRWLGIVNGGNEHFRAEMNTGIAANFDVKHLDVRLENKLVLQKNLGLEVNADKPVVAIIGRITEQKGYDLLLPIIIDILERGGQLVSLGGASTTDPTGWNLQNEFKELIQAINTEPRYEQYRDQISMNFAFSRAFSDGTNLEALICSGADIIIIPSKFEPCCLVQMNAAGCGGVIVAKKIQGLADTVTPYNRATGTGMGFLFDGHSAYAARQALLEAMDIYRDEPVTWRRIQENNMNADFSWDPVFWEYRNLIYSRAKPSVPVLGPGLSDLFLGQQELRQGTTAVLLPLQAI